jgi:hypothetical protein
MTMTTIEQLTRPAARTCPHHPRCPAANAIDHAAARVISSHQEQGWNLLCNGVITFDDTGELLPDGTSIRPHRGSARHTAGWVATSDSARDMTHCADGTGTRCAWSWTFAPPTDAIRV